MEIEYYTKTVYGNDLMYIKDKDVASHVTVLTNAVSLLPSSKAALEALGFTFTEVLAPKTK